MNELINAIGITFTGILVLAAALTYIRLIILLVLVLSERMKIKKEKGQNV